MKKSELTTAFVIVCIGALMGAYGIGLGIRKIRFKGAQAQPKVVTKSKKPAEGPAKDKVAVEPDNIAETASQSQDSPFAEEEHELSGERTQPAGAQFTNVSEEERPEAIRESRPQLSEREDRLQFSEEDHAKLREELRELNNRADEMTGEEMKKARAEIFERYGLPSR